MQCRGKAFAVIGTNTSMSIRADASSLLKCCPFVNFPPYPSWFVMTKRETG